MSNLAAERESHQRANYLSDCAAAVDGLFRAALRHSGPSAFTEYLAFAARLSNLSIYNAMLVKVQRPGAIAVTTRKKWQEIGGRVRGDATPIVILRPFGPVSFVYDHLDVDGVPVKGMEDSPLFATGGIPEATYERMTQNAAKRRVRVDETDHFGGALAGTAAAIDVTPAVHAPSLGEPLWSIRINRRLDLPTRFGTLAHELGHVYCGHLGGSPTGQWQDRRWEASSTVQREMEAEAVSWLVCQRHGITTRSSAYLSELVRESDLATACIYSIFLAAAQVEA